MSPYRENQVRIIEGARVCRKRNHRKTIVALLITFQACHAYFAVRSGMWGLWIVASFFAIIIIACSGRRRA